MKATKLWAGVMLAGGILAANSQNVSSTANLTSGGQSAGTGGSKSTYYGFEAGKISTNAANTFIGYRAGGASTGVANTIIGNHAGEFNTSGN